MNDLELFIENLKNKSNSIYDMVQRKFTHGENNPKVKEFMDEAGVANINQLWKYLHNPEENIIMRSNIRQWIEETYPPIKDLPENHRKDALKEGLDNLIENNPHIGYNDINRIGIVSSIKGNTHNQKDDFIDKVDKAFGPDLDGTNPGQGLALHYFGIFKKELGTSDEDTLKIMRNMHDIIKDSPDFLNDLKNKETLSEKKQNKIKKPRL